MTGVGLAGSVMVLAAANVLNNRIAPGWAPVTSTAATALLAGLARSAGVSFAEMGFERLRRGGVAGTALAAGVVAGYAAGVAHPRTRPLFLDERARGISRARLAEEVLLRVPLGTVLLEEVGFRGVVHALVARSYGTGPATVASSALFGLWHVLPALDNAAVNPTLAAHGTGPLLAGTVVSTGLAGALLCALRRRGGLLAPMLLHTATNSLGFLAARAALRRSAPPGRPRRRTPAVARPRRRWP